MARHFAAAIITLFLLLLPCYAVYRYGLKAEWIYIAAFFIGTFLITLIFLNWLNSREHSKILERIKPRGMKSLKDVDLETLVKVVADLKKTGIDWGLIEDIFFKQAVLDRGEVRKALVISITILYFMLLAYSMFTPVNLEGITAIFLVVIAFYFGSRTVERAASLRRRKSLESVTEELERLRIESEGAKTKEPEELVAAKEKTQTQ